MGNKSLIELATAKQKKKHDEKIEQQNVILSKIWGASIAKTKDCYMSDKEKQIREYFKDAPKRDLEFAVFIATHFFKPDECTTCLHKKPEHPYNKNLFP